MTDIERPVGDPGIVVWKPRTPGPSTSGSSQLLGHLVGGLLHGTKLFLVDFDGNVGISARYRYDPPLPSWTRGVMEWEDNVHRFVYIGFCYLNAVAEQDRGSRPWDDELIAAYHIRTEDLGSYPPRKWTFAGSIRRMYDNRGLVRVESSFGVVPGPGVITDVAELAARELPHTCCFDCGSQVPIADVWTKTADPNYALCEGCFRKAEHGGRARGTKR